MPLIATLFHHGAFTGHDVLRTREALVAYSIGLVVPPREPYTPLVAALMQVAREVAPTLQS